MKIRKENKVRTALKLMISSLAFTLSAICISVAVFADSETTQTVYIGGNAVEVSSTEGSYWYYNEADGTISESDEDNANIIINNEKQYDDEKDDGEMYMSIKNVNITSNGQNYYYFSNSGIYSLADELFLRVYGDCRISGAEYGIYANRIHLSGQDKQAKLTVTGDNTLAKPGTYFSKSEAMHLNYRSRIVSVSSLRTDFSVILRSTTNNTVYGTFTLFGSKNSIFAGADIDGADAKEFFADEDGYYQLGDKSQYKYIEYRVGIELYDKVEITDATLTFNAGDKPGFTAKLADEHEDKFSIREEKWTLLDESGNRVKWCSSVEMFNPIDEEKLLTEFEEGKTYYYSISISIDDFFSEYADNVTVTINGKSYNFDNSGNNYYYTLYMTDFIEMTPAVKSDTVINKVEISGATLSYNDGDKPVATAVTGGEFKDNYEIAYEYWEEMQQNADGTLEPVAFWYSDENMYTAATKKFTKFESGKKYMYSIGLKAKDGYKFGSGNATVMTFDGKEVATPNYIPAFDGKTAMAISLKTINVTEVQQHIHSYGKWSYDNDNHWLQCTDSNCDDLSGSIKDKAKHVFDDDKDAVCDVCGYERQIVNPGDDNMPGQPDDKPTVPGDDNKPGQPDDKPTVPGDDNKPGQPDDKPTVPGDDNKPGQPDDKPTVPGDSNNEPEDPDDKPTVPGDDNKPENPDDNNPVTPGESEDVKPGECPGNPTVNPDTDGGLDVAIFAISVVSLAGAFAVRKKK